MSSPETGGPSSTGDGGEGGTCLYQKLHMFRSLYVIDWRDRTNWLAIIDGGGELMRRTRTALFRELSQVRVVANKPALSIDRYRGQVLFWAISNRISTAGTKTGFLMDSMD